MSVYDAIHKRHKKFVMNQQISCSGAATAVDCRYRVVHHEIAPLLPSKLSLDLMGRRKRVT